METACVTNYVHFIIELLVEPLLEAHQQTYTRIAKKEMNQGVAMSQSESRPQPD